MPTANEHCVLFLQDAAQVNLYVSDVQDETHGDIVQMNRKGRFSPVEECGVKTWSTNIWWGRILLTTHQSKTPKNMRIKLYYNMLW